MIIERLIQKLSKGVRNGKHRDFIKHKVHWVR